MQVLQKRKLRHNKKPVNQHQELENITIALDAITEDGIKLVNIGRNIFFSSLLYLLCCYHLLFKHLKLPTMLFNHV